MLAILVTLVSTVIVGGMTWLIARSLAIPIVLFARWLSVSGIVGTLRCVSVQSKGAISVLTLTYFVVVFSILVQGLTIGRLIRRATVPSSLGTKK